MWPHSLSLTLSAFVLLALFGAAGPLAAADPGRVTFETLDSDVQEVEVGEIWRIRAAAGREEPPGAVVVDFAFERLFVKDSLENVVGKVRDQRKIERYTLPSGAPIYLVTEKVIGIKRAIPGQHHDKSQSLIIAREGEQQVQESRDVIREALKK